jgi:hypothetical protein
MPTVTGEGFRPIALRPSPAHGSSHLPPPQHHRHRRKHQSSLQPQHHGDTTPAPEVTTKRGEGPCSPSPPRPTEVAPQTARPCADLHRRRRSRHARHRTRPIRRPPPPLAPRGCRRHKQAMPDGGLRPRQPSPPTRVANAAVWPWPPTHHERSASTAQPPDPAMVPSDLEGEPPATAERRSAPTSPAVRPERPRLPQPAGEERRRGPAATFLAAARIPGGLLGRRRGERGRGRMWRRLGLRVPLVVRAGTRGAGGVSCHHEKT